MPWKLILFVLLIIGFSVFVGGNSANVCNINLLFMVCNDVPVYLTILLSFAAGMIIMFPFTLGKKAAKPPKQGKVKAGRNAEKSSATVEAYPAETARSRKERKKKEAAARKAEKKALRLAGKKNGKGVIEVAPDGTLIPDDAEKALPLLADEEFMK